MDKFDEWLANKSPSKPQIYATTELVSVKPSLPWMNLILGAGLIFCVFLLFQKNTINPDPNPNPGPQPTNVVQFVEAATREYPVNLSNSYKKLADQVRNKTINNGKELLPNAKAESLDSIEKSLGKINQLDKDSIPLADEKSGQWSDSDREKTARYLELKAEGHLRASK